MIQTLIFDLDDTLLWDKKSIAEALLATCNFADSQAGVDHVKLIDAVKIHAPQLYKKQEFYGLTESIGINPFEGLWGTFDDIHDARFRRMHEQIHVYQFDVWLQALQSVGIEDLSLARELSKQFISYRETLPYVYEETFEVLTDLSKHYSLALLTNGAPSLQYKKLQMTKALVPYFDRIVISGSFGVGKPDPSLFSHTLRQMNSSAEKAVMIGDNLHTDIIGGNHSGLKTIWLNREQATNDTDIEPSAVITNLRELKKTLSERY